CRGGVPAGRLAALLPRSRWPASRLRSRSVQLAGSAREPGQATSTVRWPCASATWLGALPGSSPARAAVRPRDTPTPMLGGWRTGAPRRPSTPSTAGWPVEEYERRGAVPGQLVVGVMIVQAGRNIGVGCSGSAAEAPPDSTPAV